MGHLPCEPSCGPPRDQSGAVDLDAFADWISEDVVRRLATSRQAITEAASGAPLDGFGTEGVRAQLSLIIDRLQEVADELRTGRGAGSSARRIGLLADAVAADCESGRRLIARSAQLVAGDRRPAAPTVRSDAGDPALPTATVEDP